MPRHAFTTTTPTQVEQDEEEHNMQIKHNKIKNNSIRNASSFSSSRARHHTSPSSSSSSSSSYMALIHQNPTILWVPLLLFAALVATGLTIVYSNMARQEEIARQQAYDLARETGDWFASQLDAALLPLFSLAQFATELDIFANLPQRIGPIGSGGSGSDASLPFLPAASSSSNNAVPTHRNVTGVCTEPLLVQRFDQIASTIKRNAGMQGVLVNLQLAPQGVVCLVHPLNNTEDFGNGSSNNNSDDNDDDTIFMDSTGAIGHDLLFDPARKVIAEATVKAESVIIAGPLTLVQCTGAGSSSDSSSSSSSSCHPVVEKGFIARLPITSTNGHEISVDGVSYPRWGFAVAIINWMALVERSKMHDNFASRGWTFSLTRTDYIPVDTVDDNNSNDGQEQQYQEHVHVLAQSPNWQEDEEDESSNSNSNSTGGRLRRRRNKNKWKTVSVALETTNNEWYMTVGYQPSKQPIMAATVFFVIFVSLVLATLLHVVLLQKQAHSNIQKHQAALLVQSAQDAMAAERDLNDYIAHEVRNPLSAAIAASSFITAAVDKIIMSTTTTITATNTSTNNNAAQREERAHLLQEAQDDEHVHTVRAIREDMIIVDQSLHFINDLLKSMLDMHKAASSQIHLAVDKLSVRDDVFLPVQGMLYQRDETFEIEIDCPADLVIVGDRLRLQQVVMNLARNATKFVQRGFIRLRATVIDDIDSNNYHVVIYVEDSGPGIPLDKRSNLFQRFQESLDSLNQGTGVGLYLCKKLVDLMEGQIYLDESFDSGVDGFPGTRIVVNLPMTRPVTCSSSVGSSFFFLADPPTATTDNTSASVPATARPSARPEQPSRSKKLDNPSSATLPIEDSGSGYGEIEENPESCEGGQGTPTVVAVVDEPALTLPETMNVLFVDDDRTLRKLARRCLARLVPSWNVWEASSGEMALSMITSKDEPVAFDVIFMDQYMTTSAGQALKGTETTRQLRALGFRSPIVCGLSANYDSKGPFLNCGADDFWLKPFPCALPELQRSLQKLIALRHDDANPASTS